MPKLNGSNIKEWDSIISEDPKTVMEADSAKTLEGLLKTATKQTVQKLLSSLVLAHCDIPKMCVDPSGSLVLAALIRYGTTRTVSTVIDHVIQSLTKKETKKKEDGPFLRLVQDANGVRLVDAVVFRYDEVFGRRAAVIREVFPFLFTTGKTRGPGSSLSALLACDSYLTMLPTVMKVPAVEDKELVAGEKGESKTNRVDAATAAVMAKLAHNFVQAMASDKGSVAYLHEKLTGAMKCKPLLRCMCNMLEHSSTANPEANAALSELLLELTKDSLQPKTANHRPRIELLNAVACHGSTGAIDRMFVAISGWSDVQERTFQVKAEKETAEGEEKKEATEARRERVKENLDLRLVLSKGLQRLAKGQSDSEAPRKLLARLFPDREAFDRLYALTSTSKHTMALMGAIGEHYHKTIIAVLKLDAKDSILAGLEAAALRSTATSKGCGAATKTMINMAIKRTRESSDAAEAVAEDKKEQMKRKLALALKKSAGSQPNSKANSKATTPNASPKLAPRSRK